MAARRRGRRSGPKTISGTGITGQKGVNLIEGIVLDMESRWTAKASRGTSPLPVIKEFRATSIPGLLRSTSA